MVSWLDHGWRLFANACGERARTGAGRARRSPPGVARGPPGARAPAARRAPAPSARTRRTHASRRAYSIPGSTGRAARYLARGSGSQFSDPAIDSYTQYQ